MYKYALIVVCSLTPISLLYCAAPVITKLKTPFSRRQLSQAELQALVKTLGAGTVEHFSAFATKSDDQKRAAEKGGHAPAIIMLTPKRTSPRNNYVNQKPETLPKKNHKTKTQGSGCCLSSTNE